MDCFGNNDYRDYLAHHGILGQRWGKRNGPPYPLSASSHSVAEKKAGWRESLYSGTKKGGQTNTTGQVSYKRGLKIQSGKSSIKDNLRAVNPRSYQTNCMYCTIAFELRRRGYDVEANGVTTGGLPSNINQKIFPKAKVRSCYTSKNMSMRAAQQIAASKEGNVEVEKKVSDALRKQGVGARGNMMICLAPYAGHSVAYEVTKNGYKLFDAQQNTEYDEGKSKEFLRRSLFVEYARYDNVEFNDKAVQSAVKNREKG